MAAGPLALLKDEQAELASHTGKYILADLLHPLRELPDFLEGSSLLLDLFILLRLLNLDLGHKFPGLIVDL